MSEYFEVITDGVTGKQTIRPFTDAEIAELLSRGPTRGQQEAERRAAYQVEADPLFFMAQRGEASLDDWQAKVAEIKARFPYPTE